MSGLHEKKPRILTKHPHPVEPIYTRAASAYSAVYSYHVDEDCTYSWNMFRRAVISLGAMQDCGPWKACVLDDTGRVIFADSLPNLRRVLPDV